MKFFGNVDNGTLMKPIFCNLVLLLPIFYSIYNLWIQEIFLKDSLSLFDSFFFHSGFALCKYEIPKN